MQDLIANAATLLEAPPCIKKFNRVAPEVSLRKGEREKPCPA